MGMLTTKEVARQTGKTFAAICSWRHRGVIAPLFVRRVLRGRGRQAMWDAGVVVMIREIDALQNLGVSLRDAAKHVISHRAGPRGSGHSRPIARQVWPRA